MNDHIHTLINRANLQLQSLKNISHNLILKVKNQHHNSSFLDYLLFHIDKNPFFMIIFLLFATLFFSNPILNLLFFVLSVDCIILSLIILQNIELKTHSTRLSTNVLSIFMLYFNPLSPIMTMILIYILYTSHNEIMNIFILKFIKNIMSYSSTNFVFFKLVYPDYKPIEN